MCGVAGIYRPSGTDAGEFAAELAAMGSALTHRGPDSSGVWYDERAGIGLAHRRLSIQDLSPLGNQPMKSPSGRYSMAFNGEIYNFRQLRRSLQQRGFEFQGRSDTEIMLAAFECWGIPEALSRFVGMFAFALWDASERKLYLARDRMGEKPLYYGWQRKSFVFGSELKALRRCRDWCGDIDPRALPLLLRYTYIPSPYSIYENISKLTPGTYLTIDGALGSRERHHVYWSAQDCFQSGIDQPFDRPAEEVISELEDLLARTIGDQMISDVGLGAFLSGGVDSSAVVALMQHLSDTPVKTFSIGFDVPGFNEAKHAKAVARHLKTDHHELYVTPDEALGVIPTLASVYDEPFADSSQVPTILVARLARQHVTVALSGDAGDELFSGYDRYPHVVGLWRSIHSSGGLVRRVLAKASHHVPDRVLETTVYPVVRGLLRKPTASLVERFRSRMMHWSADSLEALYRQSLSYWTNPDGAVMRASEPVTRLEDPTAFLHCDDEYQKLMYLDAVTYLPDDILVKVDRAAMAVGLETRIPFLDHRIVEFAAKLPSALRRRDGIAKWPLRQVLYRHVPPNLVDRKKQGFAIPIGPWLRGPLRSWANDLLEPKRLRSQGWFAVESVSRKWREHLTGSIDWSSCLWTILMFQAWLDSIDIPPIDNGQQAMTMGSNRYVC